ncbi:hypothetical protein [Marinibacterium sp. SX1]|uniref:hypothetical protein n=1 Tax=Marinibacterium sp. SX1 TaxID=3388424 RepID=UPI003D1769A1
MTTKTDPSSTLDPIVELEVIRWKQARFERVTEYVEDALPDLMADIENAITSMSSFAASKAQISPESLWKELFGPWAQKVAHRVEADLEGEIDALAASLSEKGTSQAALRAALPALARVSVLGASLAAIPSVISFATVTTTSFFLLSSPTLSLPLFAVGGAGLAVATLTGSKVVDRLSNRNRAYLTTRLQSRARTAALGYGLASGARCLVTDLQAFTLRSLETKIETA